ncbi:hypothetical protein HIM_03677 [Hirsutella minnesotensis 3608]|uniref:Mid2 domain-containing protein n=1 Tax=Hirsutella minnesotensis 3608 TaxID=1043627 RepID=A0A0F7ZQ83_9HYPO|nr:hypothetical protein HIM_03677 [Hirsutella minnesotensis 3608]
MRLSSGLIVGALLGCASADLLFARQNPGGTSAGPVPRPTPTPESTSESTPPTPSPTSDIPSGGTGGGGSSRSPGGGGNGADTTVTRTVTVTGGGDASTTTTFNVVTSTVTTTTTFFSTEFITSNGETATSTIYVTSTEIVDQKVRRTLDAGLAPRTAAPAPAPAEPTPALHLDQRARAGPEADLRRRRVILFKRATVTVTSTTTVGGGNSVVTVTGSSTFVTILPTVITNVITSTVFANARTTVTTTSVIKITSTRVALTAPDGSATTIGSNGGGVSGVSGNSRSGDDGDGLSSGAKAGIGVGVGAVGLAFLAAIGFCVWRRRRNPKPVHDDFMGASEVPVGGPSGSTGHDARPMSETTSAGGYLAATPSHSLKKHGASPEGYRGTAMGDGRAGYAQPASYGAAYATPSRSTTMTNQHRNSLVPGGDQLPRHPTPAGSSMISPAAEGTAELGHDNPATTVWHNHGAAEIDGQAVMSHQSGPVYEMPTQSYR